LRRPLVSVAAGLAVGVFLGSQEHVVLPPAALVLSAVFCLAACLLAFLRAAPRWIFLAALAAVLAGGAAYAAARSAGERGSGLSSFLSLQPRILRVRGRLLDSPVREEKPGHGVAQVSTRFTLEVERLLNGTGESPVQGRLRVIVADAADLEYGDEIEATLRAHRVAPPGNPGELDYRLHLERLGISGVAEVHDPAGIRATGERRGLPGLRQFYAFRRRMLNFLSAPENLPDKPGRIVRCLVLGEQEAPTDDQRRIFRDTGAMHFLVVSGLHVALLAAICWGALAALGVGVRATSVAVFLVALTFGLLSGFEHGAQRSVILCGVWCGACLLARKPAVPASLALAAICILLLNPADLFSAGLQLSFVAVVGIWIFTTPLERAIFGRPDALDRLEPPEGRGFLYYAGRLRIKSLACAALVAWPATAPLVAQHFNVFTPVAPLANFALLPLLPPLIVAGLAGALLGPISSVAAKPLLLVAAGCAWVLEWACRTAAPLPGAHICLPPPGWAILLLCYAVFAAIAYRAEFGLTRTRIAGLMLIPALAYLGFVWRQPPPRHTQVAAISVGRGNCILTRFPDGRSVLFDAGSSGRADEIAERVIAPALWSLGVRRLNLLILSHGDSDHYNGAEELARRMRVGRVAVTDYFDGQSGPASFRKPGPATLLRKLAAMGIPLTRFAAEDGILGFSGAEIEALWPPRRVPPVKWTDNELCAVVRIRSPEGQIILLTGDFGHGAAGPLRRRHPDLRADVLQVPHHGRADPDAPDFADAVRPAVAIIPGGQHARAAPYYAAASKRLLATDDCGMVSVVLDGGPPRIETFRKDGN